ncbi:MAG: hypothetical protein FJX59_05205 [Alphaproteobacteria bacterium]|nr:hypothetical protein [Alphaproteobacteria bacterium]
MARMFQTILIVVSVIMANAAAAAEFSVGATPTFSADASALDVRIEDRPPTEYPAVGHLAATPYDQAVKIWSEKRFRLTGNSVNSLRVSLVEGRITEKVLPVKKGIKGWFKKEPATEFHAALVISIAVIDPEGRTLASAEAKSWHTTALVEGTTSAEKDAALTNLVSETFAALDREIAPQFERHLAKFVRPG